MGYKEGRCIDLVLDDIQWWALVLVALNQERLFISVFMIIGMMNGYIFET